MTNDIQVKFRLPPNLKPKLEKAAAANKRSLSMEIVARLERSFELPEPSDARSRAAAARLLSMTPAHQKLEERVSMLEARIKQLEDKAFS